MARSKSEFPKRKEILVRVPVGLYEPFAYLGAMTTGGVNSLIVLAMRRHVPDIIGKIDAIRERLKLPPMNHEQALNVALLASRCEPTKTVWVQTEEGIEQRTVTIPVDEVAVGED